MYFVSVEQIQSNFHAAVTHFFNPLEVNEAQRNMTRQFIPHGWVLDEPNPDLENKIWQPVIWAVEMLDITETDLNSRPFLAPFHKKFRIVSGPCMGQVTFDDGNDIFENIADAEERAKVWIDERLGKIERSMKVKFSPKLIV